MRGLAREAGHWGDFLGYFHKSFPASRVEVIDLPGMGDNAKIKSPTSIKEIMEFTREEAKRRMTSDKFSILALSLGGMVAMEWMRSNAADLESVVLINSSSKSSAFYHRLRYQIWADFARALAHTQPRDRERAVVDILMNSENARERAGIVWSKIAQERPLKPQTFLRQLAAAMRFRGLDDVPKTPVLLLNSLGDRLVDPSCSDALHQKFGWKLERHPWAGHDLPWDDPEWVVERIKAFFA